MGLGLHGGGLEAARFFLKRGAETVITDLRDEKKLEPTIAKLETYTRDMGGKPARYVLGGHEIADFKNADIVIKNPAVRPDSPFLQAARRVETDISIFLRESPARLFAVTGTKGKSFTSSALHRILGTRGNAFLGGNITVSPLSFLEELKKDDDVVLELSSFQLGDLKDRKAENGEALLKPDSALITSIMPDHLDRYASMEEYVDDKKHIFRGQDAGGITIAYDDAWGRSFLNETKARALACSNIPPPAGKSGGWLAGGAFARLYGFPGIPEEKIELFPRDIPAPGECQKMNALFAALAAFASGIKEEKIRDALSDFRGIEHRMELFLEKDGTRFYNDSAATIPQAAAACVEALSPLGDLILVTGGTDKNLDFTPLARAAAKAKDVILLEGSGSEKLMSLLKDAGVSFSGPFNDLDKAAALAIAKAAKGGVVALSPGCASFGMFLNEFDRGRRWKETVSRYVD